MQAYPKYADQRTPVYMHPGALPAGAVGPRIVRSPGHLPAACSILPASYWKFCHSTLQACTPSTLSPLLQQMPCNLDHMQIVICTEGRCK